MKRHLLALASRLATNAATSARGRPVALPPVAVDSPQHSVHPSIARRMTAPGGRPANRRAVKPARPAADINASAAGQPPPGAATEKSASGAEVNARPLSRPAEALEVAPRL